MLDRKSSYVLYPVEDSTYVDTAVLMLFVTSRLRRRSPCSEDSSCMTEARAEDMAGCWLLPEAAARSCWALMNSQSVEVAFLVAKPMAMPTKDLPLSLRMASSTLSTTGRAWGSLLVLLLREEDTPVARAWAALATVACTSWLWSRRFS
jgi:hypothetical protein